MSSTVLYSNNKLSQLYIIQITTHKYPRTLSINDVAIVIYEGRVGHRKQIFP